MNRIFSLFWRFCVAMLGLSITTIPIVLLLAASSLKQKDYLLEAWLTIMPSMLFVSVLFTLIGKGMRSSLVSTFCAALLSVPLGMVVATLVTVEINLPEYKPVTFLSHSIWILAMIVIGVTILAIIKTLGRVFHRLVEEK
jgi:hypothetical protein